MADVISSNNTDNLRAAGTQFVTHEADLARLKKSYLQVDAALRTDGTVDGTLMPAVQGLVTHFHANLKKVTDGLDVIADTLGKNGRAMTKMADGLDHNDSAGRTKIYKADTGTTTPQTATPNDTTGSPSTTPQNPQQEPRQQRRDPSENTTPQTTPNTPDTPDTNSGDTITV